MTSSRAALIRLSQATVVTVVLGVCMAFIPLGPVLLLPFLVLPLVHLIAGRRGPYAVVAVIVSGGLLFVIADVGMTALAVLALVLLGATVGWALRAGWTFRRTLVSGAAGAVTAFVLWGVMLWQAFGLGATQLRSSVDASIDNAARMYMEMGVSQESTELVSEQLRRLFDVLPYLVPGLLVVGGLLLTGCVIALAWAIFPRMRDKVEVHVSLTGFRMHWSAAYASIIGLALLVFSRGAGSWQDVALYVGLNMLLISQTLFFFQGLAVTHWFGTTRGLSRGSRGLMYAGAVVGQALLQLTGLLGLFDTWLDCRRRFALNKPGRGPVS